MYLPANWGHMTLNIGESIGVGGQALYNAEVGTPASSRRTAGSRGGASGGNIVAVLHGL